MTEALQMVKAEMGADAMIISSRKERRKGILGLFTRPVFLITAAADNRAPRIEAQSPGESGVGESTRDEFRKSLLEPLAREIKELKEKVEQLSGQGGSGPAGPASQAALSGVSPGSADDRKKVGLPQEQPEEGFRDYRNILLETAKAAHVSRIEPAGRAADLPETVRTADPVSTTPPDAGDLAQVSEAFLEAGVGQKAISLLVKHVISTKGQNGSSMNLKQQLKTAVENTVKCSGQIKMKKNSPRIVALVGPTGVGKTTTVAKLAAMFAVRRNARIAIVTLDTFRVGAVEQIRTYSRIMGVPLEVASSRKELETVLQAHQDKDLILIDTIGRSPKDRETIENLSEMISGSFPIEVHLCVTASTRERELRQIVESFSALPVSRLIFTKLDESASFGSIINLQIDSKLPLSYFTKGQRVPEDIEPASGKRVAELILGGE